VEALVKEPDIFVVLEYHRYCNSSKLVVEEAYVLEVEFLDVCRDLRLFLAWFLEVVEYEFIEAIKSFS
jgi:hypothetical protein